VALLFFLSLQAENIIIATKNNKSEVDNFITYNFATRKYKKYAPNYSL
jgi:hypothetical protein